MWHFLHICSMKFGQQRPVYFQQIEAALKWTVWSERLTVYAAIFFLIWSERCLLFYDPGWFNQVVQNLFIDLKRLEGFSLLIKSPIDIAFIHDFLTTLLFLLLLEALKSWRFIKRQHISWYSSTRNMVKYYLVYPCKSTGYYTENVVMDFSPILKWADVFCTCSAS